MPTDIEWAQETWNPTVGCSRVSPGCDGCYAIGVAHRAMQPAHVGLTVKRPGERVDWTGEVRCLPERLDVPLRRKQPTTWFVDSMSDLFHPDVPANFIAEVWTTMALTPRHTYQVLTKRPKRAAALVGGLRGDVEEYLRWAGNATPIDWQTDEYPVDLAMLPDGWLPNVWLGTSIESEKYLFRADHLRATPAAARFLSLEPLLGPLPGLDLMGIDWVIVGGESGPGARPMDLGWAREIVAHCRDVGVAPFVKQLGAGWPGRWHRDLKGADIDTFPEDLRVREMPHGHS